MGNPAKPSSAPKERTRLFGHSEKQHLYGQYKQGVSIQALAKAGGYKPLHVLRMLRSVAPAGEFINFSSETTAMSRTETLEAISDYKNCVDVKCEVVGGDEEEASTNSRKIDTDQAERHLSLCGIGPQDAVILCAYGKTNRYEPERPAGAKNYDWQQVKKEASESSHRFDRIEAHLKNPDGRTPSLGFISCPGGTRVKCLPGRDDIQEITEGRVVFVEIDKGLTRKEQIGAASKAGLPIPTFQFDTGGKSIWSYWTLNRLVPLDELTRLRKAVSAAIEAAHPGINTDGSLHSLHQPARLAGCVHPKTGQRSKLLNVDGTWYSPDALLEACSSKHEVPAVKEKPDQSVGIWREDEPGDDLKEGHYPTPEELKVAVPLRLTISKRNAQLIDDGQEPGQRTGRATRAFSLSRALQAGEAQLLELGYDVDGNPEEEFDKFCTNSDFLGKGSLEACRDNHYASANDIGSGDLSKPALLKRITKWAEDNGHWQWEAKGFCKPKSSAVATATSKAKTVAATKKKRDEIRRSKSDSHRLEVMRRYTKWIAGHVSSDIRFWSSGDTKTGPPDGLLIGVFRWSLDRCFIGWCRVVVVVVGLQHPRYWIRVLPQASSLDGGGFWPALSCEEGPPACGRMRPLRRFSVSL